MRFFTIVAAMALTVGGAGIAVAQGYPNQQGDGGMRHDDQGGRGDGRDMRHDGRGDGRDMRHDDRGRHRGHGWNRKRHCRTVWVHHHRVRQCR